MTEPTSHPTPDPAGSAGARTFEVRINGSVPPGAVAEELLAELGEVEVTGQDVTTVLSGWFPDQQALAEFLRRLRSYGLEVVEIRRVAEDEPPPGPGADALGEPRQERP